jgi:hypothetical protein
MQALSVPCVAKEIHEEVTRSDIVGEIRERCVTERIITNVLDDAASIGVGAGMFEIRSGESRIPAQ